MSEHYWLVRLGKGNEIATQAHAKGAIAIGWPSVGNIDQLRSRQELKTRISEAYPNYTAQRTGQAAGQLHSFTELMSEGDIVLVPFPDRKTWIARVAGSYVFDPQLVSVAYPHTRRVQWLRELEDRHINASMRPSIEVPNTVSSLDHWESTIRQLLQPTAPPKTVEYRLPSQGLIRVHFERFKTFDKRVDVDLAPISVIAGVNSGGKSSIIQTLLLARQTLITPYRRTVENALEYDGDLTRFASFNEMIFGKPTNYKGGLRLGFTVQIKPNLSRAARSEVSRQTIGKFLPELLRRPDTLVNVDLDVQFNYDRGRKVVVASQVVLSLYSFTPDEVREPLVMVFDPIGDDWQLSVNGAVQEERITNFMMTLDRFIPVWRFALNPFVEREPASEQSKTDEPLRPYYDLFRVVFDPALRLLRNELAERLYYLGPLRAEPQRTYLRRSVAELDMGSAGEYVIQQLHDHWDDDVQFVELPDRLDDFSIEEVKPATMKLSVAIHSALRLLGMEQQLRVEKLGESYQASLSLLSKPRQYAAITEVGFGVSQVLPVIALGLLSRPNSLLVFEQPEIHLHPRAQAGLAEFFLCLIQTGRRIVVETHSEHLINRLRRRFAETHTGKLDKAVNILFVRSPDGTGAGSTMEQGQVDLYGNVSNWPPGFLVESAEDARAIMLASSSKRMREDRKGQ